MSKYDIKFTVQMNSFDEATALDNAVDQVMKPYRKAHLANVGTMIGTLKRDWIYTVRGVRDDKRLLEELKGKLVAALGRHVTVESFKYLDAYPGDHSTYGYTPDHLVLNRR